MEMSLLRAVHRQDVAFILGAPSEWMFAANKTLQHDRLEMATLWHAIFIEKMTYGSLLILEG